MSHFQKFVLKSAIFLLGSHKKIVPKNITSFLLNSIFSFISFQTFLEEGSTQYSYQDAAAGQLGMHKHTDINSN